MALDEAWAALEANDFDGEEGRLADAADAARSGRSVVDDEATRLKLQGRLSRTRRKLDRLG